MSFFKTIRTHLKIMKTPLLISYKISPKYYIYMIISAISSTIAPFIWIVMVGYIINALTAANNLKTVMYYVITYCVLSVTLNIISKLTNTKASIEADKIERSLNEFICRKVLEMDYEKTEDPKILDMVEKSKRAVADSKGIHTLATALFLMLAAILSVVYASVLLAGIAPWQLLVCAFIAIPINYFSIRINKINIEGFHRMAPLRRKANYYYSALSGPGYGKDIRLYNMDNLILEKGNEYIKDGVQTELKDQAAKKSIPTVIRTVISAVLAVLIYGFMGFRVVNGEINLGDFTRIAAASMALITAISAVLVQYQLFNFHCGMFNEFDKFAKLKNETKSGSLVIKREGRHTIEFKDVCFKYPRTDKFILRNFNLTIEHGEHIAIVGVNGAGKSTIIKLLCRLYVPTHGAIYLDGVNIEEYDIESYYDMMGCVFQDFKLLAYGIKENIAFEKASETEHKTYEDIAGKISFDQAIGRYDKGFETVLFKHFDESGVEPSGGEQQRIAIMRALFKDAPIIILDEPTAALDPIAESEIYEHFNTIVGNKTAIYISHRLSSTRFCDRIIFINNRNGNITESGTHDDLMRLNGEYANLFESQAEFYR